MSKLEEEICQILRKHFHCVCGSRSPYCKAVADLLNLVLEKCEYEHQN